jgi:uncharacterized membrane protein YeaQ/YmgE (transglycosylase-associated protein family)
MLLNIIIWIVFGAIAGWLASVLMASDFSQGTLSDIALGILGSLVGGFIFNSFGYAGVTGFNLYSFLVAIVGAIVVILIGRFLRSL